jgi:hypothetical protein
MYCTTARMSRSSAHCSVSRHLLLVYVRLLKRRCFRQHLGVRTRRANNLQSHRQTCAHNNTQHTCHCGCTRQSYKCPWLVLRMYGCCAWAVLSKCCDPQLSVLQPRQQHLLA